MENSNNGNTALIEIDNALESKRDLIMRTVAKGASKDEFEMFMYQCKRTGLDPLSQQIYCLFIGGKIIILASIDGLRLRADRTNRYAPGETKYTYKGNGNTPHSAIVTVRKLVKDQWFDVTVEAFFCEYVRNTPIWKEKPHVMLAKCAESLALRKAFPAELAGIYSAEEMGDETETKLPPLQPEPKSRQALPSPEKQEPKYSYSAEDELKIAISKNFRSMGMSPANMGITEKEWRIKVNEIVTLFHGLEATKKESDKWVSEKREWDIEKGAFLLPQHGETE